MEQQRKTDGAAEEFGEVGRHRRDLADDPQRPDYRLGKMLPAHFGQIAPGHDAELGRQRLIQHGDDIGGEHDPEQRIVVFRAGLNIGREIAGIHIGDRGDHRGACKQERAVPTHLAAQHLANAFDGPLGQSPRSRRHMTHQPFSTPPDRLVSIMYPLLRNSQWAEKQRKGLTTSRRGTGLHLQPRLHNAPARENVLRVAERGLIGYEELREGSVVGRTPTRNRAGAGRPIQQGALRALSLNARGLHRIDRRSDRG